MKGRGVRKQAEQAFVDFATTATPWLLTSAWMLSGDRHVAEDLVQETLVRIYLKWAAAATQPAAYARRTLANLYIDRWRRGRREVLVDHAPESHEPRRGPDGETVDLVRALRRLSPRERACVVMRHYLDMSENQTAEALQISVGSVKAYTSRGLSGLRSCLTEENHA